jgi:hypothetical protein
MDSPSPRGRPLVTSLTLSGLAIPNVVLGLYLIMIGGSGMARADDMGDILWLFVFVAGAMLELFALPSLFWAMTAFNRDAKPNRLRLILGGVLTVGSFVPVAFLAYQILWQWRK